jgi:hypothetical protein
VDVDLGPLLAIIIPIVVVQLALLIAAVYDLTRAGRRVRGDNKVVWALIIVFIQIIGPLLYFFIGREQE